MEKKRKEGKGREMKNKERGKREAAGSKRGIQGNYVGIMEKKNKKGSRNVGCKLTLREGEKRPEKLIDKWGARRNHGGKNVCLQCKASIGAKHR